MENGGSGGSGALTLAMGLAAEGPPVEAPGVRDARSVRGRKGTMGLDRAGGAELTPDGDGKAQGRLEPTLEELSGAAAPGAPRRGRGSKVGDVRASPPGAPGGSTPYADTLLPQVCTGHLATLKHGGNQLKALAGVLSPTNKVHTRIASPTCGNGSVIVNAKPCLSVIGA